jgi:hypothetical protein
MKIKKAILDVMNTDELRWTLDNLELEADDRRSRDSMLAALSKARRAQAEKLFEFLGEAQVKSVCEIVGIDSIGRRSALIERLLEMGSEKDPGRLEAHSGS